MKSLRDLGTSSISLPPSSLRLTQRNLQEFFDPEYSAEVEVFQPRVDTGKSTEMVSAWMETLP